MSDLPSAYIIEDTVAGRHAIDQLLALPEVGAGYTYADVDGTGEVPRGLYIVLNAELLLPLARYVLWLEATTTGFDTYDDFQKALHLTSVTGLGTASMPVGGQPANARPAPGTMQWTQNASGIDVYWRYSAYANDRRIIAGTGLAKGTYVAPDSDRPMCPSGLANVGRYALPFAMPAVYVWQVTPPKGTLVSVGTVRPAFGQAGGGVEATIDQPIAACVQKGATLPAL